MANVVYVRPGTQRGFLPFISRGALCLVLVPIIILPLKFKFGQNTCTVLCTCRRDAWTFAAQSSGNTFDFHIDVGNELNSRPEQCTVYIEGELFPFRNLWFFRSCPWASGHGLDDSIRHYFCNFKRNLHIRGIVNLFQHSTWDFSPPQNFANASCCDKPYTKWQR